MIKGEVTVNTGQAWKWLAVVIVLIGSAVWAARFSDHFPQKHRLDVIFKAVEHGDLEQAYAEYTNDPEWRIHPPRPYSFDQFSRDWGPSGDFGTIWTHEIECLIPAEDESGRRGFVAVIRFNHRVVAVRALWVSEDGKTVERPAATPACG